LTAIGKRDLARVFFALWPDSAVREALAALARDAQAECGGRATRADKIHLTLFFVGEVERHRLAVLRAAAAAARSASFELVIDRLGYFRRARIAWAGADCPPALASLVAQLAASLAAEGIEGEARPYVPHITLAREAARHATRTSFEPIIWRAQDFVLVESGRAAGGSSYEILERWRLD
jgi:RNA 2',3'-cyclic 3'-phosphodiesterase